MEKGPFFSILIPTYNQARFIDECLNGILKQSFINFELIVSDDSSNDETKERVSLYQDQRIKYFRNNPPLGRVENYRTCILDRAKGEWCLICDGDDYLTDVNYLAEVENIIERNPDVVLIQAGHYRGQSVKVSEIDVPQIQANFEKLIGLKYLTEFSKIGHFSHLSTVSKLSDLKVISPFHLAILSSDIETYLRLAVYGQVYLIKKPVGVWRQHADNVSGKRDFEAAFKNLIWIESVYDYWLEKVEPGYKNELMLMKQDRFRSSLHQTFKIILREYELSFLGLIRLLVFLLLHGRLLTLLHDKKFYLTLKSFIFYKFKFSR